MPNSSYALPRNNTHSTLTLILESSLKFGLPQGCCCSTPNLKRTRETSYWVAKPIITRKMKRGSYAMALIYLQEINKVKILFSIKRSQQNLCGVNNSLRFLQVAPHTPQTQPRAPLRFNARRFCCCWSSFGYQVFSPILRFRFVDEAKLLLLVVELLALEDLEFTLLLGLINSYFSIYGFANQASCKPIALRCIRSADSAVFFLEQDPTAATT